MGPVVCELEGFRASEPIVFDVTAHRRPVRLSDPTPVWGLGNWRVREDSGGGTRLHYVAFRTPRRLGPHSVQFGVETEVLRGHPMRKPSF